MGLQSRDFGRCAARESALADLGSTIPGSLKRRKENCLSANSLDPSSWRMSTNMLRDPCQKDPIPKEAPLTLDALFNPSSCGLCHVRKARETLLTLTPSCSSTPFAGTPNSAGSVATSSTFKGRPARVDSMKRFMPVRPICSCGAHRAFVVGCACAFSFVARLTANRIT